MEKFINTINENSYIKFLGTIIGLYPCINWFIELFTVKIGNNMETNFDYMGLITALITSAFLLIILAMSRYMYKQYVKMKRQYDEMKIQYDEMEMQSVLSRLFQYTLFELQFDFENKPLHELTNPAINKVKDLFFKKVKEKYSEYSDKAIQQIVNEYFTYKPFSNFY